MADDEDNYYAAQDCLDAIRLADAASQDDTTLSALVREILCVAPPADESGTTSTRILIDAYRSAGGTLSI